MFLVFHYMFIRNTNFDFKSISKIWKTYLFYNSLKSLNLGYHHPYTFTRIYFSIQMQWLIKGIMVYHMHTHSIQHAIDWQHIRWYDMNVGPHSLEDRFYRVRWVPNTFPSCNTASKLRLRVDIPMLILVIFNF